MRLMAMVLASAAIAGCSGRPEQSDEQSGQLRQELATFPITTNIQGLSVPGEPASIWQSSVCGVQGYEDYHFCMTTNAILSDTGILSYTTEAKSTYLVEGFSGQVTVVVTDANGNQLMLPIVYACSHSGEWIDGNDWKQCTGSATIPLSVLNQAQFIAITETHSGHNRLVDDLQTGIQLIGEAVQAFVPILGALNKPTTSSSGSTSGSGKSGGGGGGGGGGNCPPGARNCATP